MATKKTIRGARAAEQGPGGLKSGGLVTVADGTQVPAAELGHVAPDLWPLVVSIDTLTPDPRNARVHGAQNLDAIARSLNDNGQLKALSTDADGVVLAGDGTLAAARSLGWKWIARVRCGLTGPAARRWAIQDNRTAELAEWDQAELQNQVAQLEADLEGFSPDNLGFNDVQFDALLNGRHRDRPRLRPAAAEGAAGGEGGRGAGSAVEGDHRLQGRGPAGGADRGVHGLGGGAPPSAALDDSASE